MMSMANHGITSAFYHGVTGAQSENIIQERPHHLHPQNRQRGLRSTHHPHHVRIVFNAPCPCPEQISSRVSSFVAFLSAVHHRHQNLTTIHLQTATSPLNRPGTHHLASATEMAMGQSETSQPHSLSVPSISFIAVLPT